MRDYTGDSAADRVFYVNLVILKYGTNDKVHAAALILSMVLLIATIGIYAAGFFVTDTTWAERAAQWLGSAFLFVAGVALGKAGSEGGDGSGED